MKEELIKRIMLFLSIIGLFLLFSYFFNTLGDEIYWTNVDYSKKQSPKMNSASPTAIINNPVAFIESKKMKLLFFGDLMIDRHVAEVISAKGMDYLFQDLFLATSSTLQLSKYELVSANLEGAVTDGGAHYSPVNAYDFAFAPDRVEQLREYGFNFFSLANNHFSDQGERGIIETRKNLDDLKIPYVGCKDGVVDDCSTKIIDVDGYKLGMAGFSQVYSLVDIGEATNVIGELASTSDLVIVNIHWGTEYKHVNGKIQKDVAHKLIDNGADIIIGHHPHVVQGMEIYDGKPIFYSLGNFIFDQYFSVDTQSGLALGIAVEDAKVSIKLLPLESNKSQVNLVASERKNKFFDDFISWSDLDDQYIEEVRIGQLELTIE